jgi:hypothetical protein
MHRWKGRAVMVLLLLWPALGSVVADELPATDGAEPLGEMIDTDGYDAEAVDEDEDDTADYDVDSTVDYTESSEGLAIDGDLRAIVDYFDRDTRDGASVSDERLGVRVRLRADFGITDNVHVGARLAGTCFTGDCDPEFVLDSTTTTNSGLKGGQFTFDELYLQWFRTERGAFAFGRLQTRFVLRGGVYAKSLDRNNSNNVNVNWTDGLQATYRARNGWNSSFVLERNARDGTGSIRRGQLDFDDSKARNTYFAGFENITRWGPVSQRGFDVSYLPASLLKDGDPNGRREDYWGFVGRLMFRWPQRSEGIRFRGGTEIGYAPETATSAAANLDTSVSGLAWNIVASIMDFRPRHNIGINYAQTGAGWLLSPQYRPNEELFEIRYQYRPKGFALLEARVRWREDLEQQIGTLQKREEFDFYLRATVEFTVKDR